MIVNDTYAVVPASSDHGLGTSTNRTALAAITIANTGKATPYPHAAIRKPVRTGPIVWPMSMIVRNTPTDAPNCPFFVTSATSAVVEDVTIAKAAP